MALNEEQKEYLVKKISKYEKETNINKKMTILNTCAFATQTLAAVDLICKNSAMMAINGGIGVSVPSLITKIIALGFMIGATISLKGLISSIVKKAGLERQIDEIQDQFALDELEDKERVK